MHHTPWTSKQSSVPSDRIKPSHSASQPTKGKGKAPASQEPKSREVRRLESLLSALRVSQSPKKDPNGGCFCQAREHPLSSYTSICRNCGLILCNINQPHFACPHCLSSLIPGSLRDSLVVRIQAQLDQTIAREVAARERAIEEAKRQAGAFPTLSGAPPSVKPIAPQPQTHKVISLNSKTKKVKVSSYTTTPVSSRPASRSGTEEEEAPIVRVPPPPTEVSFAHSTIDPARPWANLRDEGPKYVPLPAQTEGSSNRKGRRRKGKGKDNEIMENGGGSGS
ncbi:hypothetical protein BT96DRAFT_1018232 [Gymnopus androsaceus JB14]|uniref:TRIP4/RQT4 C2HC5-type zinc finger domain-containing protein n=1 Tax=Gymnopus androsaceus JB14 TaxID=1447944 RepID=A0A6A4HWH7_9AGAR|nr:hypothetical protein BT96DRAFT_1018232 [Gymnopus androsaceus JB14]